MLVELARSNLPATIDRNPSKRIFIACSSPMDGHEELPVIKRLLANPMDAKSALIRPYSRGIQQPSRSSVDGFDSWDSMDCP
jgi:hypothetical protein